MDCPCRGDEGRSLHEGCNIMRTNDFLNHFPPQSHSWAGKVAFSLSYPHAGWITFGINSTTYIQTVSMNCSQVFDPFPEIIRWLEDIIYGSLPSEFSVDEESQGKTLRAQPVNKEDFLFTITPMFWQPSDEETEEPLHLYMVASKRQFITVFLRRWEDFLVHQWDAKEWEGNDLSLLDVSRLRTFVEE